MRAEKLEYGKKPYIMTGGAAIVFTFIAVLSLLFNLLNIMFLGLAWWGFWMFIPAFFLYISAAESYLKNKRAAEQVVKFIKAYDEDIYLDKLGAELNLSESDVKAIVADAISKGEIKARIDPSTGKLLLSEYKSGKDRGEL